jgi:hypothetical protein
MTKASDTFMCVCCHQPHHEDEASFDDQLGGPVDNHCRKLLIKASAWLKHAGISRPIQTADINMHNCNRFKGYKI